MIAKGKLGNAINFLLKGGLEEDLINELVMISSRYEKWFHDNMIIGIEDDKSELRKIEYSLLKFLSQPVIIEENTESQTLREKGERIIGLLNTIIQELKKSINENRELLSPIYQINSTDIEVNQVLKKVKIGLLNLYQEQKLRSEIGECKSLIEFSLSKEIIRKKLKHDLTTLFQLLTKMEKLFYKEQISGIDLIKNDTTEVEVREGDIKLPQELTRYPKSLNKRDVFIAVVNYDSRKKLRDLQELCLMYIDSLNSTLEKVGEVKGKLVSRYNSKDFI